MARLLAVVARGAVAQRGAGLARASPIRFSSAAPAPEMRLSSRPPPNQHVLALIDDAGKPIAVEELWARVGEVQESWPEEARQPSKSSLKRELNYLRHHKLVRTIAPGEAGPFRYAILRNKYVRRLPAEAAAPAPTDAA